MVNLVAAQKPLLHGLMKLAGLTATAITIDSETVLNIWVPTGTLKSSVRPEKPVVVLVHGFAAEGIVTWQFQVASLTKKYNVYVPDLLFFGGSITDSLDRSPEFQAKCLVKAMGMLGIEKCTLVGFSYGGMVAFELARWWPELVEAVVISGSVLAITDLMMAKMVEETGASSSSELLLPTNVDRLKALLKVAMHKKIWFPNKLYKDFLEVMFSNRKEREQLLEALDSAHKDIIPSFSQRIHLLWGENDRIFNLQLAQNMKKELGDKVTLESIGKAGHLVHLERPCVYNRCLKKFLASVYEADAKS